MSLNLPFSHESRAGGTPENRPVTPRAAYRAVRDVVVKGIKVNGEAAKVIPKIEQNAYDITIGPKTI